MYFKPAVYKMARLFLIPWQNFEVIQTSWYQSLLCQIPGYTGLRNKIQTDTALFRLLMYLQFLLDERCVLGWVSRPG